MTDTSTPDAFEVKRAYRKAKIDHDNAIAALDNARAEVIVAARRLRDAELALQKIWGLR